MRHWAGDAQVDPQDVSDAYIAQAGRLGIDWRRLQAPVGAKPRKRAQCLELWREHHITWDVFVHCANCWQLASAGMGVPFRVGLPRSEVLAVMRMYGVARSQWPAVLEGIRIAEDEALEVWAERRR